MSKAQKTADGGREPFRKLSDSETLLFLARSTERTAERQPDMLAKLQSLKDVLTELESTLLDWPSTPGKVRMWSGLAKAKSLVVQITADSAAATPGEAGPRGSTTV